MITPGTLSLELFFLSNFVFSLLTPPSRSFFYLDDLDLLVTYKDWGQREAKAMLMGLQTKSVVKTMS